MFFVYLSANTFVTYVCRKISRCCTVHEWTLYISCWLVFSCQYSCRLFVLLNSLCIKNAGMMGSGKTTVGKILSEVLGYSFFDRFVIAFLSCFSLCMYNLFGPKLNAYASPSCFQIVGNGSGNNS